MSLIDIGVREKPLRDMAGEADWRGRKREGGRIKIAKGRKAG